MKAMIAALAALAVFGLCMAHPWLWAVLAVLTLLIARLRSGAATGAMTARIAPGHYPRRTARHEAGHVVAARRLGLGVASAVVNRDGSGHVRCARRGTAAQHIGFLRAGEYAIHTGSGAGTDRANVRAILRRVPAADRARVRREGERLGRQAARSWAVGGVASTLTRKGHL
jgi:hypothetical protein